MYIIFKTNTIKLGNFSGIKSKCYKKTLLKKNSLFWQVWSCKFMGKDHKIMRIKFKILSGLGFKNIIIKMLWFD